VPLVTVEGITVHTQIGSQVSALVQAARSAGFALAGGGYRSPAEQIALRRSHCGTSQYAIYEMPASQCSPPTARPGSSNHERGLAIDFTCNGGRLTRGSACFQWLAGNAASYGFFNLPSEPWHWSIDGS
jgi:LAS superfamily LD-carboxypeptidase LdcB